jgi:hypothetical protein
MPFPEKKVYGFYNKVICTKKNCEENNRKENRELIEKERKN